MKDIIVYHRPERLHNETLRQEIAKALGCTPEEVSISAVGAGIRRHITYLGNEETIKEEVVEARVIVHAPDKATQEAVERAVLAHNPEVTDQEEAQNKQTMVIEVEKYNDLVRRLEALEQH